MQHINFISADEAVKVVKSGDHIHLSSVASAPQVLIQALCRRADAGEIKNVFIHHLHTEGPAPYTDEKYSGIFLISLIQTPLFRKELQIQEIRDRLLHLVRVTLRPVPHFRGPDLFHCRRHRNAGGL